MQIRVRQRICTLASSQQAKAGTKSHSTPAKQSLYHVTRPTCSASGDHPTKSPAWLTQILASTVACTTALALAATSWAAVPLEGHQASIQYDQVVQKRRSIKSSLPNSEQSKALLELYRESYTDDAFQGMLRLQEYATYVEQLEADGIEAVPGCEQCEANRIILEKAWQVVANEFFDPSGQFSQAQWAAALLDAIKGAGGALHTKKELYQAAGQMVASLGDPYSAFLSPSQFRRALRRPLPAERNYLAAQYVGVGLQLGEVSPDGGRVVDAPLAGSPAEAAGIVRGDRILDIDGVSADKVTQEQALALLRGPEGSLLTLTLARADRPPGTATSMELERRRLPQPPVKTAQLHGPAGGQVGYARLFYFSSETTHALEQALSSWEAAGMSGYILDLRNNPGGTFEEAIAMAAALLPEGRIITETVRNMDVVDTTFQVGQMSWEVFGPPRRDPITSMPVVVLVNSSSASASEVLAGALRDNGRAVLIGEQTFGKGVLQYYFPMTDGSGLKLTVAKYLGPSGYDISHAGGLKPDLVCHDFPRGVLDVTEEQPDACVLTALDLINPSIKRPSSQQASLP